PAARKRAATASAAEVTLPEGVSVVLISINCLKMSRAIACAGVSWVCWANPVNKPANKEQTHQNLLKCFPLSTISDWNYKLALYGSKSRVSATCILHRVRQSSR